MNQFSQRQASPKVEIAKNSEKNKTVPGCFLNTNFEQKFDLKFLLITVTFNKVFVLYIYVFHYINLRIFSC